MENAPEASATCTDGWHITGYYVPVESDFGGTTSTIQLSDGDEVTAPSSFIGDCRVQGWGRLSDGSYVGWDEGNQLWRRSSHAENANGVPLRYRSSLAVDKKEIPFGSKVTVPEALPPWNTVTFIADDVGDAISKKHIDIFCGEGAAARHEALRITSPSLQVCVGSNGASGHAVLQRTAAFRPEVADGDASHIATLVANGTRPNDLAQAKALAGEYVNRDPTNTDLACAATLSCLLDWSGISAGIIQSAPALADWLQNTRGWQQIGSDGFSSIQAGDVGVFRYDAQGVDTGKHHIYLVLDTTDPANPIVADNQGDGPHQRPVGGGDMPGVGPASATNYFLRAT